MAGLNKVMIIGRLTRDPEIRHLSSGYTVVNFSIATSESWKDKASGEKKESTEYHNCVSFGKQAEIIAEYLSKGSMVYVEGKLKTDSYEKDGIKRYNTKINVNDVQFLDNKRTNKPDNSEPKDKMDYGKAVESDEIPF